MNKFNVDQYFKDSYDDSYDGSTSKWRWITAIGKADNIISLCHQYPHSTILEVGSGEGSVLKRLSDLLFGEKLYALEISDNAIKAIKARDIRGLVSCSLFDGYTLPFEDETFDLVILTHVVEHLEYPRRLLYEVCRVGKYVFIEVPLEDTVRLANDFVFKIPGHINFYSLKIFRLLVQSCKIEILDERITNFSYQVYKYRYPKIGWTKYLVKEIMFKLFPILATKIWRYNYAIVCRANSD